MTGLEDLTQWEEDSHAGDPISFFAEDVDFHPSNVPALSRWITSLLDQEGMTLYTINVVFCSDAYLHQLNVEYLSHDTLTDVITFPYQDPPAIEGDIFISIERVLENASAFQTSFTDELHRVIIHGVLHLCGYSDKSPGEKRAMTDRENEALGWLPPFSQEG